MGRLAEARDPETVVRALRLLRAGVSGPFYFDFTGDGHPEGLIGEPKFWRSLGEAARRQALAEFGQDRMVQEPIVS